MGSLYRRLLQHGNLEKGKRCDYAAHGKADLCPSCGARFTGPFWVKYYRNGRPIRESSETFKETEARSFLKRQEGDVAHGRPVSPQANRVRVDTLLDDLLTDYRNNERRSLDVVQRIVSRLKAALGHHRAHVLSASDVRAYIAVRQGEGAENATINREMAALKRAFNLALKDEKILRKPYIPTLAENNVRTGFLGEVEYLTLHEALPAPLNHLLTFAYTYGWRRSEILGLQWNQVDFQAGTVRLDPGTTKNREGRTVVLTEGLKATLRRLWEETRSLAHQQGRAIPWVFHRDGERIKDFRGAWTAACKTAGYRARGDDQDMQKPLAPIPHDLRRTAVRNMVRAGIPERVAMMISGHKTRSVFDRYDIVSETDLREAARKLGGDAPTMPVTGTILGTVGHSENIPDFVPSPKPSK